ncbi:zf-HC2 domain-containing protein [Micromonospora sp. SH-82]|uniref:zf-HC2 domain-containing protein n=1 Tax=Micromonospora sp. SH-82 TaxID=3132938 RepID=UPI003EBA023F
MGCEGWREILSAQLDGEETPAERVAVQRHLETCAGCRSWLDLVAGVNRRARTQVVPTVPDLTEAILAAAAAPPPPGRRWRPTLPRPRRLAALDWRPRMVAGLRAALGLLGAVQLVLGLVQVARGGTDHVHLSGQHLWHEAAAWNVAVGAGFVFVALRRTPPAGLLPMLSAFVATLLLLSVNDLVTSQVAMPRLASHAFLVGGYLITVLLSRPGLHAGGPPPHRRSTRSRWRLQLDDTAPPPPATLRLLPPHSAQASTDRHAA